MAWEPQMCGSLEIFSMMVGLAYFFKHVSLETVILVGLACPVQIEGSLDLFVLYKAFVQLDVVGSH